MEKKKKLKVAVISDTHGVLRESVLKMLENCDYILHAGDFDNYDTWRKLDRLGVLCAVCGNNDKYWNTELPLKRQFTIGDFRFFMVHNRKDVPAKLDNTDFVIFGHSHRYFCQEEGGRIWLNPGSCGRARFGGNLSMVILELEGREYRIQKIPLDFGGSVDSVDSSILK